MTGFTITHHQDWAESRPGTERRFRPSSRGGPTLNAHLSSFVRRAVAVGVTLVAVLVGGLASGCAPQSPDHSSWTDQARLALEDGASSVATAELLLRLAQDDKVFGKTQQVVAQDSESAIGKTLQQFGGEQPEPEDDDEYAKVTGLLSDASDLLSQVRIAVVRRDTGRYPSLLRQLKDMQKKMTTAEDQL
jgi:hypothetical protein